MNVNALYFTQTEKQFQRQVVELAKLLGWRFYHTLRSEGSPPGWPDLVLIRRPRVIFAELKSERNALTSPQRACLEELRACGQEVFVWRPSDWEQITEVLR